MSVSKAQEIEPSWDAIATLLEYYSPHHLLRRPAKNSCFLMVFHAVLHDAGVSRPLPTHGRVDGPTYRYGLTFHACAGVPGTVYRYQRESYCTNLCSLLETST